MTFNNKVAKQVAQRSFDEMLDCVLGRQDPDYSIATPTHVFEQNFEEDLQEMGINPTPVKIIAISKHFDSLRGKAVTSLEKLYSK